MSLITTIVATDGDFSVRYVINGAHTSYMLCRGDDRIPFMPGTETEQDVLLEFKRFLRMVKGLNLI